MEPRGDLLHLPSLDHHKFSRHKVNVTLPKTLLFVHRARGLSSLRNPDRWFSKISLAI